MLATRTPRPGATRITSSLTVRPSPRDAASQAIVVETARPSFRSAAAGRPARLAAFVSQCMSSAPLLSYRADSLAESRQRGFQLGQLSCGASVTGATHRLEPPAD